MGQQVSKDELLYQQVNYGNVEGIKTLHREGAGLEWVDGELKTPLILACMNPDLYNVAKTLIELGANVNGYRPGRHAGCPLHHAAKRGLDQTVKLLLTHGANALRMNDDCQTPLDIARAKRYSNVVRTIESHISLFSGWLRQLFGPRFLEALAPQLLSRKIWVVVMPIPSSKPKMPLKLVVSMYSSLQDAQPFSTVQLWKAKIEEPLFHQPDPAVIIFNKATRKEFKLASANEGDKQQLQWFCNACRGIPQVRQSTLLPDPHAPTVSVSGPSSTSEDLELAMAINASIESAIQEGVPILPEGHLTSEVSNTNGWGESATHHQDNGWSHPIRPVPPPLASSSDWLNEPSQGAYNGWGTSETVPSSNQSQPNIMTSTSNGWEYPKPNPDKNTCGSSSGWLDKPAEAGTSSNLSLHSSITSVEVVNNIPEPASVPSAPPISVHVDDEPVRYPSIDTSPVDLSMPSSETKPEKTMQVKEEGGDDSSTCVICLDAPVEGACIPCGHMAGCMSCLNEIKTKIWGCPVCRAKIDQVLRLYTV